MRHDHTRTSAVAVIVLVVGAGLLVGGPAVAQESPEGTVVSAPTSHEFRTGASEYEFLENGIAEVGFDADEGRVVVSGAYLVTGGCADPDLESAVYSVENDTLTVRIGETVDTAGVDCPAVVTPENYTAAFDVEDLPGTVRVVHNHSGVVTTETAGTSEGVDSNLGSAVTEFRTRDVGSAEPTTGAGSADATIDAENGEVVVDGTIVAPNGCTDADLESATYDVPTDTLVVTVDTYFYADGFACSDGATPIDYTGTFSVDQAIETVEIRHARPTGTGYETVTTVERGEGPAPLPGASARPTDPDGDGRYEDVNGDGDADFDDVVEFFQHFTADAVRDSPDAFDFNGNDRLDFDDVIRLFRTV